MASVLITGAGRRIGAGLATRFAAKGWDVVLHYHTSQQAATALASNLRDTYGVAAHVVQADVRQAEQVAEAFARAAEAVGELSVLVNNAGVFPERKPVAAMDEEFWDAVLHTNLRSQFTAAREFLRQNGEREGARIVNIGSLGGIEIWKERVAYNVSKAGVLQLTKALAREFAPRIAVNCVAPGIIHIPNEPDGMPALAPEAIPMQRYGSIDDVFDAVYFFSTCSPYITGQVLFVDGGRQLM